MERGMDRGKSFLWDTTCTLRERTTGATRSKGGRTWGKAKRKSVPAPPMIHLSSDLNRNNGGKDDDGDEKVLKNGDPFKVSQQPISREECHSAQGHYQTFSHIHQFIVGRKRVKTGIKDNSGLALAKTFRPITRCCRSMLPLPGSGRGAWDGWSGGERGQLYVESLNSTAKRELQLNQQKNRRTE
jgi:hypothetical protein